MDNFKLFDDLREQKTRSGEISHANPGSAFNHADIAAHRKLIDSKTLDLIIGLSASSRYRYIKRGLLPQPVRWPGCKNLWNLHEVYEYIKRNNAKVCLPTTSPDTDAPYAISSTEEACESKQGGQS